MGHLVRTSDLELCIQYGQTEKHRKKDYGRDKDKQAERQVNAGGDIKAKQPFHGSITSLTAVADHEERLDEKPGAKLQLPGGGGRQGADHRGRRRNPAEQRQAAGRSDGRYDQGRRWRQDPQEDERGHGLLQ